MFYDCDLQLVILVILYADIMAFINWLDQITLKTKIAFGNFTRSPEHISTVHLINWYQILTRI